MAGELVRKFLDTCVACVRIEMLMGSVERVMDDAIPMWNT